MFPKISVTILMKGILLFATSVFLYPVSSTYAHPKPSPASSILPNEDLNLPSFDVIIASGEPPYRVGDPLVFKTLGTENDKRFTTGWSISDQSVTRPGDKEEALQDQGWNIEPRVMASPDAPSPSDDDLPPGHLRAVPIKSGKVILPSLLILDEKGQKIARTNPFELDVTSAIANDDPKPNEPEQIEPPVGLSFPIWVGIVGLLILGAFVGAFIYGCYRWRKRVKKRRPLSLEPELPEDEVALRAIAALELSPLLSEGKFKSFYFQLSDILKTYLGKRFQFNALESTTHECMSVLKRHPLLDQASYEQVFLLSDALDLVKFTDHVPPKEVTIELVKKMKDWVSKTRRSPSVLSGALENQSHAS